MSSFCQAQFQEDKKQFREESRKWKDPSSFHLRRERNSLATLGRCL